MSDIARKSLCDLIARYGSAVSEDPQRCRALLSDYCPDERKEIRALVLAAETRVTVEIRSAQGNIPATLLIPRLAKRLHDQEGLAADLAGWAVESWALALGLIGPDDTTRLPGPDPDDGGAYDLADDSSLPTPQANQNVSTGNVPAQLVSVFEPKPLVAGEKDAKHSRQVCESAANYVTKHDETTTLRRLSALCTNKNTPIAEEEVPHLIQAMNDWSNRQVGYIRNIGDKSKILAANRSDAIRATCRLLVLHRRISLRRLKAPVSSGHTLNSVIPHALAQLGSMAPPKPPKGFEEVQGKDTPIPGSIATDRCDSCGAQGRLTCPGCGGHGRLICGRCNGQGQMIESYTEWVQELETTWTGQATGRLTRRPSERQRVATCSSCGGGGQVRCSECKGNGHITCPGCEGHGKISHELCTRFSYWPFQTEWLVTSSTLKKDTIIKQDANEIVCCTTCAVDVSYNSAQGPSGAGTSVKAGRSNAANRCPPEVRDLENEFLTRVAAVAQCGPCSPLITQIEVEVDRVIVESIRYEYGKKTFSLHLAGRNRKGFADSQPSRVAATFSRLGGFIKDVWTSEDRAQASSYDPAEERHTKGGQRAYAHDPYVTIANWLEEHGHSFDVTDSGYSVKINVPSQEPVRLWILLDGTTVRMLGLIAPAKQRYYRDLLLASDKLAAGCLGITKTSKGAMWICCRYSLYYDTADNEEIASAVNGAVRLITHLRHKLK